MYFEIDSRVREDKGLCMLRNETHRFAEEVLRPAARKLDKMADPEMVIAEGSPYWDALKQMKKMGYHRMFLHPEYGGLGLSAIEAHIILEELGWGSVGLATAIGVDQVPPGIASLFAMGDIIDNLVRPWAEDTEAKFHGCWGVTEPECGSDYILATQESFLPHVAELHHGQVRAEQCGDGWAISGPKSGWLSSAPAATHVGLHVVLPPYDSLANGALCIVPLEQKGVTKGKPIDKLGMRDDPQGELVFDNVYIPDEYMIIRPPFYEFRVGQVLCLTSSFMGALFTGLARAAFEEALEYSKNRIQGGKPICEHQAIKQKLYSMFEKVETSRYYTRKVMEHVWEKIYVEGTFDASSRHALCGQIYSKRSAFEVAFEALQIFGGYGLTKDFLVEKLFRDARAGLIEDGTTEVLGLSVAYNIIAEY
ncbi:MAG: acyl-CoA dehydrogenase [Chloroflexi bacterium]|nr:acyl-CoA dehydrogenase [Chloroflexota bacterium]MBM3172416.1 acyl-CoA dehydrogenase [Chloroflexota bacterium]MBM3174356.1 acyl-CoA dehydrogenase [Chloroflexota bacterium]MBM4450965.1 acyl-CoA dehydrogenase [Chloroflexota bacterium]